MRKRKREKGKRVKVKKGKKREKGRKGKCEIALFLEPRINVQSVQHCVSRRQQANINSD